MDLSQFQGKDLFEVFRELRDSITEFSGVFCKIPDCDGLIVLDSGPEAPAFAQFCQNNPDNSYLPHVGSFQELQKGGVIAHLPNAHLPEIFEFYPNLKNEACKLMAYLTAADLPSKALPGNKAHFNGTKSYIPLSNSDLERFLKDSDLKQLGAWGVKHSDLYGQHNQRGEKYDYRMPIFNVIRLLTLTADPGQTLFWNPLGPIESAEQPYTNRDSVLRNRFPDEDMARPPESQHSACPPQAVL